MDYKDINFHHFYIQYLQCTSGYILSILSYCVYFPDRISIRPIPVMTRDYSRTYTMDYSAHVLQFLGDSTFEFFLTTMDAVFVHLKNVYKI